MDEETGGGTDVGDGGEGGRRCRGARLREGWMVAMRSISVRIGGREGGSRMYRRLKRSGGGGVR